MDEGILRIFNSKNFDSLHTQIIGRKIYKYDTVTSTNDVAFRHALEGEKEGLVFWARSQTKGRGRLGRSWISHKDKGVYFSIILRPQIAVKDAPKFTLMAGVGIAKALGKFTGLESLIKWPNDIFIKDKKIGGILTEIEADINMIRFIVIGIGLNTNLKAGELPVKEATSLKILLGKDTSNESLLGVCLKELDNYYLEFKKYGFRGIIEEARSLSSLWGRQVKIETLPFDKHSKSNPKGTIEGVALDFDEDGALVIRQHNGFRKHIFAGDVRLLR